VGLVALMDERGDNLVFVGAAYLPARFGTLSATWPFGWLSMDQECVCLDLRPNILKRMASKFVVRVGAGPALWSVEWAKLASVDVGRRSVVLRPHSGASCRFVMLRRDRIGRLIPLVRTHGVEVRYVSTTAGWFLRRDVKTPGGQ
jgi:hypothetical protein